MNLVAIRSDLAEGLEGLGFNSYSDAMAAFVLPAVVVGLPDSIAFTSMRGCTITIPIHLLVSTADTVDAWTRLTKALTNRAVLAVDEDPYSVLDALRTMSAASFNGIRVVSIANFTVIESLENALGCDIVVELMT